MKPKARRYITLLIALSFSWLFIGSLVNFHRVHLHGKSFSLDWSFVKPKSEKSKFQLTFKPADVKSPGNLLFTHSVNCSPCPPVVTSMEQLPGPEDQSLYSPGDIFSLPCLRAPPTLS